MNVILFVRNYAKVVESIITPRYLVLIADVSFSKISVSDLACVNITALSEYRLSSLLINYTAAAGKTFGVNENMIKC